MYNQKMYESQTNAGNQRPGVAVHAESSPTGLDVSSPTGLGVSSPMGLGVSMPRVGVAVTTVISVPPPRLYAIAGTRQCHQLAT